MDELDTEYMTPGQAAAALAGRPLPPLTGPEHTALRLRAIEERIERMQKLLARFADVMKVYGWDVDD